MLPAAVNLQPLISRVILYMIFFSFCNCFIFCNLSQSSPIQSISSLFTESLLLACSLQLPPSLCLLSIWGKVHPLTQNLIIGFRQSCSVCVWVYVCECARYLYACAVRLPSRCFCFCGHLISGLLVLYHQYLQMLHLCRMETMYQFCFAVFRKNSLICPTAACNTLTSFRQILDYTGYKLVLISNLLIVDKL